MNKIVGIRKPSINEEIQNLSKLSPIEYELVRESTADRLAIRVSVLDKEVAISRPKGDDSKEFFDPIEIWDDPVDGRQLVFNLVETFNRFSILPKGSAMAASLWTILTYCYDEWITLPIMGVLSPEKRCGKSTFMTTLDCLCCNALSASNISPAAFFRVIEAYKPCLLIDEGDTFLKENEALRGVINSGHTKTQAYVVRCDGDANEPVKFTTWAPKAIAMIGQLPSTIEDRAIIVPLKRKLPSEHSERHTLETRQELSVLKRKILRFAEDNQKSFRNTKVPRLETSNDRQADNWEPLLTIAHVAQTMAEARASALFFLGVKESHTPIAIQMLQDIDEIFTIRNVDKIFSADLVNALVKLDDRPWSEWRHGQPMSTNSLSKILKQYGIQPKLLRIKHESKRGYRQDWFVDPLSRYLRV